MPPNDSITPSAQQRASSSVRELVRGSNVLANRTIPFMRDYTRAVSILYVESITRDIRARTPRGKIFVLREPSGAFYDSATKGTAPVFGPGGITQLKRQYLTRTLRDVERNLNEAFSDQETKRGKPTLEDAPASAIHKTRPARDSEGSLESLSVEGLFGSDTGLGSLSSSRESLRNSKLKTNITITPNRGVLTISGLGIVRQMLGGLIYVPEGGFRRVDDRPFAMYKPETTDVVFRSRIYKKYGGRWIQRRGLLSKLFKSIGDVIGYGGFEPS